MVGCGAPVTEWEKRIKFHVGNGSFLFPLKRLFTCNTTVLYSYCCNGTFSSLLSFSFFVILCNTQQNIVQITTRFALFCVFLLLGAVERCPELGVMETRLPVDTPFLCIAKLSTSIEIFKLYTKILSSVQSNAFTSTSEPPASQGNLGNL